MSIRSAESTEMLGGSAMGSVATAMRDSLSFHRSVVTCHVRGGAGNDLAVPVHFPYSSPCGSLYGATGQGNGDGRQPISIWRAVAALARSRWVITEALAERSGLKRAGDWRAGDGQRRRPYPHTVAALADALGLTEENGRIWQRRGSPGPPRLVPSRLYRVSVRLSSAVNRTCGPSSRSCMPGRTGC